MAKVRLAFLGPPYIELDGAPVHLDTRKAIALMVYLSVIGKPVSRDTLVTLLWSRYGRAEGHSALRRTLSTLRSALGREFINAERETVSLPESPDIWIDLSRFQELLTLCASHAHGQPAICRRCLPLLSEAAKLYRGQFLHGFTLKDSVDFDDWQFFTTEKYRLEAVRVLDRLALCSAAAGDFRSAIGYAHERLGLDRLDESAHVMLMRLFAWEGNRAAAKHQFDECQRLLKKELDSPPQQATLRLAESIAQGRIPDLPAFVDEPQDRGRTAQTRERKSDDRTQSAAPARSPSYVVAVLPFDSMSDDAGQSYSGDRMTADLIAGLATIEALRVPAGSTMLTYKGKAVNVQQIGKDLAATHIVGGSVRKSGSRIRIDIQLIDAGNGNNLWAKRYDKDLTDIFAAQDEIVHDIVTELDPRLARSDQDRTWGRSMKNRIAVLPFVNISPDPNDEYFADGLTEELISAVSKIGGLRTISRSSAMRFKSTDKTESEIAAELHVGAVVEGSVRKAGNQVRISVQLVDVRRDENLWSQSYDRQLEDIFAIQSDIASKIAQALQVHILAQEWERIKRKATGSIESYNLYLRGLHDRAKGTEDGYKSAMRYFEQALSVDPKFALAYAGLAECYDLMGDEGYLPPKEGFLNAEEFARKALSLDDSLAEAHATLGAVMTTYYYDQSTAEEEFRRALELNPNYGKVCNSYGVYLACMGRLDEAVAEIVRAQELNPLALDVNSCAAVTFNCANLFDKSVEACERMFMIDENFLPAYRNLAEAYYERSRYDDAIEVLRKAARLSKGAAIIKAHLGFAYARSGRTEEARALLRELEDESKRKYVAPIAFALVHCGLSEKTEAIQWLSKACEERAGSAVLLVKVRPMWASLRSELAFSQLLERMGLSPSAG